MHEFETTLELAGAGLPVLITYELDPSDGRPLIERVEVAKVKPCWDFANERMATKRVVTDITEMLEEWQLTILEGEIQDSLADQAVENQIDRYELDPA